MRLRWCGETASPPARSAQRAIRIRGQSLSRPIGQRTARPCSRRAAGLDAVWIGLFEHLGGQHDRPLGELVLVATASGGRQQEPMVQVHPGGCAKREGGQGRLPAPQLRRHACFESQPCAIVAMAMRVVIALFFAGVHRVGERRVEKALNPVSGA